MKALQYAAIVVVRALPRVGCRSITARLAAALRELGQGQRLSINAGH